MCWREQYSSITYQCTMANIYMKYVVGCVSSDSPCHSDDDNKPNFFERGMVLSFSLLLLTLSTDHNVDAPYWHVSKHFAVKSKSRQLSKSVANDFGTVWCFFPPIVTFFPLIHWCFKLEQLIKVTFVLNNYSSMQLAGMSKRKTKEKISV